MRFDEHFLKGVLPDIVFTSTAFPEEPNIVVDSRVVKKGDIFIALKGSKHDGHEFVNQAIESGASGIIIAHHKKDIADKISPECLKKIGVALVPDTLEALSALATAWRAQFQYPVVAITGSVGKTSTKETVCNILSMHGVDYVASLGNQNTAIGLAMNIFNMRAHHKVAVFELGINKRGEMAKLAAIAHPTIAVITNIGHAHMEGLGSLQDIAIEKKDIFKYFTEKSIGIINGDQNVLSQAAYVHPVIKFGTKTINQVQARKIYVSNKRISFTLKLYKQKFSILLRQTHEGAIFNSLAAAAVGYLLNIPGDVIARGLAAPVIVAGRFETLALQNGNGIVINDCYNANPESMKAALQAFQQMDTKDQKIAVLGDMLELGVNSPFWHRQLGRFLRKVPSLNHIILVGSMVHWTKKTLPFGLTVDMVPTWQEAVTKLEGKLNKESTVLVKGSFDVGLSNIVDAIAERAL
jgi:UDP-N-acetylmuramoyl-tripeptide--D-alanyl-D-alanine ligase